MSSFALRIGRPRRAMMPALVLAICALWTANARYGHVIRDRGLKAD